MNRIEKRLFGKISDGDVFAYTMTNKNGVKVSMLDYGATVVSIIVPDREGNMGDIALGFDSMEGYLNDSPYFGSTVGRVANRIGGARFEIDGVEHRVSDNEGGNCLHAGMKGFDKVIWDVEAVSCDSEARLEFRYVSADGEEGYPGELTVCAVYRLTDDNELIAEFEAVSDKATPVNMTNHTYFNLRGEGSGDVLGHELAINAAAYTPVDESLIPTGEIAGVDGSALDFREVHAIGERIAEAGGYDHNYVLDKAEGEYALAAVAYEKESGRVLEAWTSEPGVQFYSGNSLWGIKGKGVSIYNRNDGFCLEPQKFPDSVNKKEFASPVIRAGEVYKHKMAYVFGVR